jgi:hypothetical protein
MDRHGVVLLDNDPDKKRLARQIAQRGEMLKRVGQVRPMRNLSTSA